MFRLWFVVTCLALGAGGSHAGPADDGRWYAGAYSFSDELGGFHILHASGSGTRDDPIVLVQRLVSASAVTLVIEAAQPINPVGKGAQWATGMMHIRIVTVNHSGLPWIGFNFELQEILGTPSTFGDGLSFDQRKAESNSISMDRFDRYERQFEPYDRLTFTGGHVDPDERATFRFFISDFTPLVRTYLLLDPQIPFS